MDKEIKTLSHAEATMQEMAIRFGPKALVAVLILVAGYMVARWVAGASNRGLERIQMEPPVRILLVRVVRIVVLLLFMILALQNLGVELLPLIAGLGVAGAGIALATQGVLSNVVAGLTIIFTKPYRVGESISIVGVDGTVEAISLFSTVLRHADRSVVVIPNRKIVGEILHNYGKIRQTELSVGVAYGADLQRALQAIESIVRADARVLAEPQPLIQVSSLGSSSIKLTAKPWVAVADYGAIESAIYIRMIEELGRVGVEIPLPQAQIRLIGSAPSG
jgi:small conductance mechanosensitive channel